MVLLYASRSSKWRLPLTREAVTHTLAFQTTDLVLKRRHLSSLLTSALAMSPCQGEKEEELCDPLFHKRHMQSHKARKEDVLCQLKQTRPLPAV
jgi:hypothetical protein